jgi:hypothetical protein
MSLEAVTSANTPGAIAPDLTSRDDVRDLVFSYLRIRTPGLRAQAVSLVRAVAAVQVDVAAPSGSETGDDSEV